MRTFFDSSAFAKHYVEEAGSQAVDAICAEATQLALSVVCIPEIISALNRRVRDGGLSRQQYEQAKRRLSEDVEDAAIVNLTSPVLADVYGHSGGQSRPGRGRPARRVCGRMGS